VLRVRGRLIAAWIGVAGGSALLSVGIVRLAIVLQADAIGYIAVARNWILGRGDVIPSASRNTKNRFPPSVSTRWTDERWMYVSLKPPTNPPSSPASGYPIARAYRPSGTMNRLERSTQRAMPAR
jgi:hypothetical protein